jgi:hypothetical protein
MPCSALLAAILRGERAYHLSPAEQQAHLGLAKPEYYSRRRSAAAVLFELLGRGDAAALEVGE